MADTTAPVQPSDSGGRYPLVLTLTGVIAMVSLYLTAVLPAEGRFAGTLIFAGVAACSQVVRWRLPDRFLVRWGLRMLAWAGVLTILGVVDTDAWQFYVKPEYMARIGPMLAAEFALRCWLAKPASQAVRVWGEGLFLTSLVFIPATTTFDRDIVMWAAPLYLVGALLTLRRIARVERGETADSPPATGARVWTAGRRWSISGQRVGLSILALALGIGIVAMVTVFDRQVASWAARVLQNQFKGNDAKDSEIGMSNSPVLQGVFNPTPSIERALTLQSLDATVPVRGERHLRIIACDTYDGRAWGPSVSDRKFVAADARALRAPGAGGMFAAGHLETIRIQALSVEHGLFLAVPAGAVGLSADVPIERDTDGVIRSVRGEHATAWMVETPAGGDGPLPTTLPASTRRTASAGAASSVLPDLSPDQREVLLAISSTVDPAVIGVARRIAGTGTAADKVARLSMYLRTNNAYSLSFQPVANTDPLNDFILNKRAAHCQYFASAMVIMSRAAGVPARYVGGYYAHEAMPEGGTLVRERDAHAWAECYVDGPNGSGIWVVADATPAGGRPDAIFPPPTAWQRFWEAVVDLPGKAREWLAAGGLTHILLVTGIGIGAILGLRGLVVLLRRRRAGQASTALPLDPRLAAIAREFERLLTRTGVTASPPAVSGTWRERLGPQSQSADIAEFLLLYERARFGGEANLIEDTRRLLRRLETGLTSKPGSRG